MSVSDSCARSARSARACSWPCGRIACETSSGTVVSLVMLLMNRPLTQALYMVYWMLW